MRSFLGALFSVAADEKGLSPILFDPDILHKKYKKPLRLKIESLKKRFFFIKLKVQRYDGKTQSEYFVNVYEKRMG